MKKKPWCLATVYALNELSLQGKEMLWGKKLLIAWLFFPAEWAEAFKKTNKAVCNRMERNLSVAPSQPNIRCTEKSHPQKSACHS